jgi:hypothetical protein
MNQEAIYYSTRCTETLYHLYQLYQPFNFSLTRQLVNLSTFQLITTFSL